MKIKIAILLLISLVSVSILHGQFFSVSDIETGRLNDLRPADLRSIQWRGTKPVIVFSNNDSLLEYNILEERKNLLLTPGMMNRILRPDSGKEITKIPPFYFVSEDIFLIKKEGIGYLIDLKTGDLKDFDFPEDAEDWVISRSDRIAIAYTLAGNIYVIDQDGQTSQVTSDTVDGISNGDLVYRNEFGITHGMAWSPDGARLVYYRRDETAVEQYPIVDITFPMARIAPVRYPMAGREMEKTDVWVYSASDQSSIMLGIAPDAGVYHTNLTWSHGGDRIYIQHLNRGQDTMKLRSYSATTGEFIEEYLTETHPKYIEPLFHVVPLKTKPGGFLYLSEKSGYNHLYECLPGKKVPKQLTEGNWEITEISGIDDTEKFVYFMATIH